MLELARCPGSRLWREWGTTSSGSRGMRTRSARGWRTTSSETAALLQNTAGIQTHCIYVFCDQFFYVFLWIFNLWKKSELFCFHQVTNESIRDVMIPKTHGTISSWYIVLGAIFITISKTRKEKMTWTMSFNNKCDVYSIYYLYTICFTIGTPFVLL